MNRDNQFFYIILFSLVLLISYNFSFSYLFFNPTNEGMEAWIEEVEYDESSYISNLTFVVKNLFDRQIPCLYNLEISNGQWITDTTILNAFESRIITVSFEVIPDKVFITIYAGDVPLTLSLK